MKFMVMANNKYMVSVEAETNLSAEHKILDEIYDGMQSALSFDKDTMKTDHFRACLMDCETISFSELMEMSKELRVAAAAKQAGLQVYKGRFQRVMVYFVEPPFGGQGFRRTNQTEAICGVMKELGYDAGMYYRMD